MVNILVVAKHFVIMLRVRTSNSALVIGGISIPVASVSCSFSVGNVLALRILTLLVTTSTTPYIPNRYYTLSILNIS